MENNFIFDSFTEVSNSTIVNNKKIHIRIRQRNGRQSFTIIENLSDTVDLSSLAQKMRQTLHCNAFVKNDDLIGKYIQLFGDQRVTVKKILINNKIADDSNIVVHGY
jgi:translation initiation factor 1